MASLHRGYPVPAGRAGTIHCAPTRRGRHAVHPATDPAAILIGARFIAPAGRKAGQHIRERPARAPEGTIAQTQRIAINILHTLETAISP